MTHLITGATGNIGGRVVEQLLALGERPRIFVRSVEKAGARFGDRVDIAQGDLADARTLTAALEGIDSIFLVNDGPELALRDAAAANAAKAAGVKRVVKLSSMAALGSSALGAWHSRGEAAVRASGLSWVFIQPVGFMSNSLAWAPSIKARGLVQSCTGEGRIPVIHSDDIADVATRALTTNAFDGTSLVITGPRALSYAEMVATIGKAIGKPLVFESISDDQARKNLLGHGMPAELADALVGLWCSVREGGVATVTDTVERVLGRKPMAFETWAQENAAAFL